MRSDPFSMNTPDCPAEVSENGNPDPPRVCGGQAAKGTGSEEWVIRDKGVR